MTIITPSMSAVLSLLCVFLISESASAQTRLFVTLKGQEVCNNCQTEYALEIDVDTPRIVDQSVIHDAYANISSTATADGRFLVWIGKEGLGPLTLSVLDTVTNSIVIRARPQSPLAPNAVYAHPGRTRIFVSTGANIIAIEPDRQQTFLLDPGCAPNVRLTGVSRNGERLFVSCSIGLGIPGETRVLDNETGAQLSTIAELPPLQAPNAEGTELFTIQSAPSARLTRRDAMTGAVLAQQDIHAIAESAFDISVDPLTGRVFLVGTIPPPAQANHLTIFEPADLSLVTQLVVPHHGGLIPQILKPAFSDDGRAYFTAAVPIGNQLGTRFSVFDTVSAVRVTTVDVPTSGTPSGITVASKPHAPTDVTSSVAGQSVTLQWNAGPGPAPRAYILNVGLSSGATDLTIDVPFAATEYAVGGVPSGTYYVRVRSKNAGGALSAPSQEIQVVVP